MKNLLSRIALIACALVIFGVNLASAQENKEKVVSYNFINEYGFFLGNGAAGFTSVFVNGVKIKNSEAVGIGIGYGYNTKTDQELPIFLNYRHFFNRGRKLVPIINVGVGTAIQFYKALETVPVYVDGEIDHYSSDWANCHGAGLYATIAGGFNVKAFSFNGGAYFKTFPNTKSLSAGLEVKVGYTF